MAMQAIDNQIEREIGRRSPSDREEHGVQKWEPFQTRIERTASFLLNSLGDQSVQIDSLLVFSQAFAKTLNLLVADLGEEGLGELRSRYMSESLASIARDIGSAQRLLKESSGPELN